MPVSPAPYNTKVSNKFISFYIVKKETKYWYNITSDLCEIYFRQLDKNIDDIGNNKFTIYNL